MTTPPSPRARVQKRAPDFQCQAVIDSAFEEVSLNTYVACNKWLLLCFIPMAWTFVCPTEIIAFSERVDEFTTRGASVVFASTDSEYSLLAWCNTSKKEGGLGGIRIPLLSDKNHQLSKNYGVLLEEEGIALRGQFLIDPRGTVRQITINDVQVGRSVDEALRLIDAFKFTDEYGEVCPANWNPSAETMKATPSGNREFLDKKYSSPDVTIHAVNNGTKMTNGDNVS